VEDAVSRESSILAIGDQQSKSIPAIIFGTVRFALSAAHATSCLLRTEAPFVFGPSESSCNPTVTKPG
jgi:hypothetical protein